MQTKDNAVIIGLLVKISTGQVPDNMNDTVFAKIIRKEIPATIIYEDAESIAFLDIMPLSKGHTLLVPKEWFERIQDTLCGLEESIACYKIYQENLKALYPKIYKEVTTLRKLEKDEACFPEKQI